jgi:hypothetical protein
VSILSKFLIMLSVSMRRSIEGRMVNEYGAVGGMRFGRGNQNNGRKLAPVLPCQSEI